MPGDKDFTKRQGEVEPISVDSAYTRLMARPHIDRLAYHQIRDLAEEIDDENTREVKTYYPGFTTNDFKDLRDRLTQAIRDGKDYK